jgi:heterodisulfide reductase subunit C
LLVVALASGFLLEAQKIASPLAFERMADQYAAAADADARASLRAWWAREFGVPYERADARLDDASVAKGRALHDEACASCHAKPVSAFVSWPLSRLLAPLARALDAAGAGAWLLHLHALAIVAAVATLPFTRFFHAVASPFAMLLDAVARIGSPASGARSAALRSVRRAVALDACVRCGLCDAACSVAPLSRWLGNDSLLPSRKLRIVGDIAGGRLPLSRNVVQPIRGEVLRAAEGAFLCTDCGRCTSNCPVALDLADLWEAGRRDFAAADIGPPEQWIQARTPLAWSEALRTERADARASPVRFATDHATFARCIQCQACTSVCPVVAHGADGHVDLTPQRVMNLLRLGRGDLALGSRMVLACASCYQCEEHCPEAIPVARIMLELRAMAASRLGAVRDGEAAS